MPVLELGDRRIAYHRLDVDPADLRPGIVFLGGFGSTMQGNKAVFLEEWARGQGRAFLRFDYTGHGESSGVFEDGCISDWAQDARDAVEHLTVGPQILVGSSMGGWISLLLARTIPQRIAGLVGIAAAPDFTVRSKWERLSAEDQERLMREGRVEIPSAYQDEPYILTRRLIEDGRHNLIFNAPLSVRFPVRLLQGMKDPDVPWETAPRLADHIEGSDILVTLIPDGDHRLSTQADLNLLIETLHWLERRSSAIEID